MNDSAADSVNNRRDAHFRAIFEHSLDAIAIYTDWPPSHEVVNASYARLFGYESPAELVDVPSLELIAPSCRDAITRTIERRLAGLPVPAHYETRGLRKDGTEFDLEINGTAYESGNQKFRLVILRDITARKAIEAERRAARKMLELRVAERTSELTVANARLEREVRRREQLQAVLCEITELHHTRLGIDLHDGVGQELTGIEFMLSALQREMEPRDAALYERLATISDLLTQTIRQTRDIARGLFPVKIEEEGLEAALRHLVHYIQNLFKVRCQLDYEAPHPFGQCAGQQIYRIVQEAMNNAVKHGKATEIVVSLTSGSSGIRLCIRDDGCGFPEGPNRPATGMGLTTIDHRVRTLDGQFTIKPQAQGGSVVKCNFPLSCIRPTTPVMPPVA